MKALILVGGFGTRLRPLTLSRPKPLVEFANKPIVMHQIEALVKVGVKEVVLAVSYQSDMMVQYMESQAKELGIKISISKEDTPMGTAGPLALARDMLEDSDVFFVLNSDVICDFPLALLLQFHNSHGGEGTIFVTKVKDPSKYGVVLFDEKGKIQEFVEKPQEFVGDKINAGIYIFNPEILKRIPMKPTSIEREIFPKMAREGLLYAAVLPSFWMDIGQPKDYLKGLSLYLGYLSSQAQSPIRKSSGPTSSDLAIGPHIIGNVMIHETATIGSNCLIGPDVSIGPNCVIGDGVRILNSAILDDSVVKKSCYIRGSIVGWKCVVGEWCRLQDHVVLGEDVTVAKSAFLNGTKVLFHKEVKDDELEPKVIM